MNRRDFLRLLSLGAAATAAGLVLPEPERVRRWWAVPRNAPLPERGGFDFYTERDWNGRSRSEMREMTPDGRGGFLFRADGNVYQGSAVYMTDDQTVAPCPMNRQPVGVIAGMNGDGTAWVQMGPPREGQSYSNLLNPNARPNADSLLAAMASLRESADRPLALRAGSWLDRVERTI